LTGFGVIDVDSLALYRFDRDGDEGVERIRSEKNCIVGSNTAVKGFEISSAYSSMVNREREGELTQP